MARLGLSVHRERWETSEVVRSNGPYRIIESEVYAVLATVASISDDFEDNIRNTSLWNLATGSGTPSETGGMLSITPLGTGFGYSGYTSVSKFNLAGSSIYVKVPSVANNVTGAETQFSLNIDSTAEISFVKGGASLIPRYRVGSTNSDNYPTYNATNHLWWKIREAAGVLYWDVSPDGTTWTNLRTQAHTYTATQLQNCNVWLRAGQYQALTPNNAGGTTTFDNLNVTPLVPPTTDLGRLQDVYAGWKQRQMRSDGVVLSHVSETRGVSEGQSYALVFAVQFNDQTTFDLVEQYTYAHFDRRNSPDGGSGTNTPTVGFNLMAYNFSTATNKVLDWAAAYDADIDRAKALLWAHFRWGSAGAINYQARALAILGDLVTYGLRQSSFDSKWYMVSGTGNMSISEPEMNNSYLDPAAFRLFAQYDTTNATKWLSAVDSSYDIIQRTANAVLPNPVAPGNTQTTTAKLPANWVTMNFTTGVVSPLSASYRDTDYTYDAFRQANRMLFDYKAYGETRGLARLQDYKTFLANQWTTNGYIRAEYFHDGTERASYSTRMFYYAAYQSLITNDPTNTAGLAIYAAHLQNANMYVQSTSGSYFDSSTDNSGNSGYYGSSWLIFDEMERQNVYTNYGQAVGITVTPNVTTLATATFAPSSNVSNNQSFIPVTTVLNTSGFTPTVTASDHKTVTPNLVALNTVKFAPVIVQLQTVTPSVANLNDTHFAPAINITNHQTVTPGVLTISTTGFVPSATPSDNKSFIPTTASLAVSAFAPTVVAPIVLTPSPLSLAVATFAPSPSLSDNKVASPNPASLTTTTYTGLVTATDHKLVTPPVATVITSQFAPNAATTAHQTVTPNIRSLITASFAPSANLSDNKSYVPSTISLTTTKFAPLASASDHKIVTPSTTNLTSNRFATIVTASNHQIVTPTTRAVTTGSYVPTIIAPIILTPAPSTLTTIGHAPTIPVGDAKVVLPNTANLTLSPLSVSVTATDTKIVTPSAVSLTSTKYTASVSITAHQYISPTIESLVSTWFAPTVTTSNHRTYEPVATQLELVTFNPAITLVDLNANVRKPPINLSVIKKSETILVMKRGETIPVTRSLQGLVILDGSAVVTVTKTKTMISGMS